MLDRQTDHPQITPEMWDRLRDGARQYPALARAVQMIHECVTSRHRGDCMGAADSAAKELYVLADDCWLFDDADEAARLELAHQRACRAYNGRGA